MGKKSGGRVRVKQVGAKAPVNPLDALTIPPDEMINFPPKPDTNIAHVWPISEFLYWCTAVVFVVSVCQCHFYIERFLMISCCWHCRR